MTNKAKTYTSIEKSEMDRLLEQHAELVHRIAYHLSARLPATVLVDDLIQAGLIGLMDAASHYDPSQGAAFETYASIRIRGSMLDELRRNDWAPKSVHRKSRDMLAAVNKIEARTGRDARPKEIARTMGISIDEYHQLVLETNTCRVLNFTDVEYEDQSFSDGVSDDTTHGPLKGMQREEFKQFLAEAIKLLPEREQLIISLYYDEELNLKEIGSVLGVSESRVSQLMSQAHTRMRNTLKEFIEAEAEEVG
ncbi:MAG: RNA polymerase sigma factor FliA [Thioalkalispiraceae bacterium]|jgi:RNA polymerase sigma factor for flagellar operon FliA